MSKLNERLFEKKVYKIATDIIGEERIIEESSLGRVRQKGILPDFCGRHFEYKDKTKFIKFWKKFFSAKKEEAIERLGKKKLNIWWRLKPEVEGSIDFRKRKIDANIEYTIYARFVIL